MKLVRYGQPGKEKPGLIDAEGKIRDLSSIVPDLDGEHLGAKFLDKIRRTRLSSLPTVRGKPRLGSPVAMPGNFIGVGLNYVDHANEAGLPIPTEPILFNKAPNCVIGPNDPVVMPKDATKLDYEVELAIVIGERASHVSERAAMEHIAGFCLANDVSERAFQMDRGGQWMKGKSAPTFGPLGPWLVTPDEIENVQRIGLWLDVNGERRQTGNTKKMIFTREEARLLYFGFHGARSGRCHRHRHAARRRHGHEAAEISASRRCRDARRRRSRRTAARNHRLEARDVASARIMRGLDPRIQKSCSKSLRNSRARCLDGRVKPGHDASARASFVRLDQIRPRRPGLERSAEILRLAGDFSIAEFHDAHGIGWHAVIAEHEFGDPEIAAADNPLDGEALLARLHLPALLNLGPTANAFARLRISELRILLVDLMLDDEIIGIGCRPVAIERGPYLTISHLDLPQLSSPSIYAEMPAGQASENDRKISSQRALGQACQFSGRASRLTQAAPSARGPLAAFAACVAQSCQTTPSAWRVF